MAKRKFTIFGAQTDKPDSCAFFKPHWICWKILGIRLDIGSGSGHQGYLLYSIVMNIVVTICYPVHLGLALFRSDSMADNLKNLSIFVSCVACSMKFIIYATKLQTIKRFEHILKFLDEGIVNQVERDHFKRIRNRLRNIGIVSICCYLPVGVTAELACITREGRSLLYPAWFPFNWLESAGWFAVANLYQGIGIFFLLVQNYIDDNFPPMALCVLSGHIEILSMRMANIGYDGKSLRDNEEKLNRCIEHHQRLYELFITVEDIISWPFFIQICVSATSICLAIAVLLFFASTPLDIAYYIFYSLSLQLEIFPTCYYGSNFQYLFDELYRSAYASNWIEQTPKYKKHMILLTERSLKQNVALAGGMFRIHLDTFFSSCQGAYSLLALIMNIK